MWLKHIYFTVWGEFYWEVYKTALFTIVPSKSNGKNYAVLLNNSCEATRQLCLMIDYVVSNNYRSCVFEG
jgi:hypothetical protein